MHICQLIALFASAFWMTWAAASPETDGLMATAQEFERAEQYERARVAYEEAETAIGVSGTGFEPALAPILMGKGRSLRRLGRPIDAVDAFEQALHVLRRSEGVYTLSQLEVIDELTDMALEDRDPLSADTQQRLAHYISARQFGDDEPESLPSHLRLTEWYINSGQYARALRHITSVLDKVQIGPTDPRRIQGHVLAAKARRLQGICCSEKALKDVLTIVEANPDLPADTRNSAYLALGDALTISRKPEDAAYYYGLTGEEMTSPPQLVAMMRVLDRSRQSRLTMYKASESPARSNVLTRMTRDESLSANHQPPQLFFVPLGSHQYNLRIMDTIDQVSRSDSIYQVVGRPFQFYTEQLRTLLPVKQSTANEISKMKVTLSFTVEADGSLEDAVVIDSNAPLKVNRLMLNVIDNARYRPALQGGVPVRTENVTVTQTFPMPPEPA